MIVVVSLKLQRAYVYRNGVMIGVSTVSSGTKGHETPTGVFTVLQKQVDHKSNLYDNAPMPFMQRLTWDGIAMHAGKLPGYPASHGCIRLPTAFAQLLYGVTQTGMTVIINDEEPVPRIAPARDVLGSGSSTSEPSGSGGSSVWKPELAPTGPISIVISAADRRMIVLRNGKEIGATSVNFLEEISRPVAYVLQASDSQGLRWLRLNLPWDRPDPSRPEAEDGRHRLAMDDGFRTELRSVLTPGTTVVLTPDTLKSGSSGATATILSNEQ